MAKAWARPGTLLVTVIVGTVVQCLPGLIYVRRRSFVGWHRPGAASGPTVAALALTLAGPETVPAED